MITTVDRIITLPAGSGSHKARPDPHSLELVRRMYANARKEGSRPAQVPGWAVEVSGFNSPRSAGCRIAHSAAAASACTSPPRQPAKASSRRGGALVCPRRRLGAGAEAAARRSSWTRWEAVITAGPGLPSSTAGQQNNRQQALSSWQLSGREAHDGLRAEQR